MYSGFYEIGNAIYTQLLTLKNTDLIIWDVYNYDIKVEQGVQTPAIVITPANWSNNIFDSCLNQVSFNFNIRVLDSINQWVANVEDNMRKIAWSVMLQLKSMVDVQYDIWVTYKVEFSYNRWFTDTQESMRVFEIIAKFMATEQK